VREGVADAAAVSEAAAAVAAPGGQTGYYAKLAREKHWDTVSADPEVYTRNEVFRLAGVTYVLQWANEQASATLYRPDASHSMKQVCTFQLVEPNF
jgi:hypothetical protein